MIDLVSLLRSIAKRPGLYVGTCSIELVGHYLDGYIHALRDTGHSDLLFDGAWIRWVESRFLVASPAWGWPRILLHGYGSHQAAIEALPHLYEEYLDQRSRIGIEGIEAERKRRLIAEHGREWYEPTADPEGDI